MSKWHIWDSQAKNNPLYWDKQLLEFQTQESALKFLESVVTVLQGTDDEYDYFQACVAEDVDLTADTGFYLDATDYLLDYDVETGREILIME